MPTIKQVELIDKKRFAKTKMDKNVENFVIYITSLILSKPTMRIHLARKAQIALLFAKEVKISIKYSDFSNMFLEEKVLVLPKISNSNQYTIKLQDGQ